MTTAPPIMIRERAVSSISRATRTSKYGGHRVNAAIKPTPSATAAGCSLDKKSRKTAIPIPTTKATEVTTINDSWRLFGGNGKQFPRYN